MSKTPYTKLRDTKQVGDLTYAGPEYMDEEKVVVGAAAMFWRIILGPFRDLSEVLVLRTLYACILVFVGALIAGMTFVYAQFNAQTAGTDLLIRSFILALVGAAVFVVPLLWSHFDGLPIVIFPAHSIAMVGTSLTNKKSQSFGLVLALLYVVFQVSAFLAAGGILRALGVTGTFQNAAASANTHWMYWFGASVICFSFIYNWVFRQSEESPTHTGSRAAMATAFAVLLMTVAFYTVGATTVGLNGLNNYSGGFYLTQIVVANYVTTPPINGVVEWAFFFLVDLLAVPATAVSLVVLFAIINYFAGGKSDYRARKSMEEAEELERPEAEAAQVRGAVGGTGTSARLRARTPIVNY